MISFSSPSWRKFKKIYTFLNPDDMYKILEHVIQQELETKDWVNITVSVMKPKLSFKLTNGSFYYYLKKFKQRKELIIVKRKLYYRNVGNELTNNFCIVDMNQVIKNLKSVLPVFEISKPLQEQLDEIQEMSYNILHFNMEELEGGEYEI